MGDAAAAAAVGGGTPASATPAGGARAALGPAVRALIDAQERELTQAGEARARGAQGLLRERERELEAVQGRFRALREDFAYNLSLLQERDAELERHEGRASDAEREAEGLRRASAEAERQRQEAELRAAEAERRAHAFEARTRDAEAALESARRANEEDARARQQEVDRALADAHREVEAAGAASEEARRELAGTYDGLLREREAEYMRRHQEMSDRLQAAEHGSREARGAMEEASALRKRAEGEEHEAERRARAAEAALDQARRQVEALRESERAAVEAAERDRDEISRVRGQLLDEYELKCEQMVKSLQSIDAAFQEEWAAQSEELGREREERASIATQLEEASSALAKSEETYEEKSRVLRELVTKHEAQISAQELRLEEARREGEKREASLAELRDALDKEKLKALELEPELKSAKEDRETMLAAVKNLQEQMKFAVPLLRIAEGYSRAAAEAVPDTAYLQIKTSVKATMRGIQKLSGGTMEDHVPLPPEEMKILDYEARRLKDGRADALKVFGRNIAQEQAREKDIALTMEKYKALKQKLREANGKIKHLQGGGGSSRGGLTEKGATSSRGTFLPQAYGSADLQHALYEKPLNDKVARLAEERQQLMSLTNTAAYGEPGGRVASSREGRGGRGGGSDGDSEGIAGDPALAAPWSRAGTLAETDSAVTEVYSRASQQGSRPPDTPDVIEDTYRTNVVRKKVNSAKHLVESSAEAPDIGQWTTVGTEVSRRQLGAVADNRDHGTAREELLQRRSSMRHAAVGESRGESAS